MKTIPVSAIHDLRKRTTAAGFKTGTVELLQLVGATRDYSTRNGFISIRPESIRLLGMVWDCAKSLHIAH